MKCNKFIDKRVKLKEAYNKMAEKEKLKQFLEDPSPIYSKNFLFDQIIVQKHQDKKTNTYILNKLLEEFKH